MEPQYSWLDDGLVSEALGDGVEIINKDIRPALPVGEHYLSTLLRVTIDFKRDGGEKESTNLIIKTFPEGVLLNFIKEFSLLHKELVAYRDIFPLFDILLIANLTPKSFKCKRNDIIVLEDLKLKGFEMVSRINRLDFEHAEAAIKALADFHAASYLLHENNPHVFEEVKKETMFVEENIYQKSFVLNNFKSMADEFESFPELQKYCKPLREAGEASWTAMLDIVKPKIIDLNVFNHGDFWTNNILFKHDENGKVLEVKFVDFQFCRWTTPAMDLQMLFYTSIRNISDIPSLKESYLDRLNQKLPLCVRLSKEQLETALRSTDSYALVVVVTLLPICILNADTPLDFKNVTKDDYQMNFPTENPYFKACRNPKFKTIVPEHFDYFISVGVL